MEIKINCLRNGIEGGGVSNGPATLLDGYGTYLYDLYKPSDEDVAAHPELADEPLGIVYPFGNMVFKMIQYDLQAPFEIPEDFSFKISDLSKMPINKRLSIQFLRSCFPPSMVREIYKNGTPSNIDAVQINYIKENGPLRGSDSYWRQDWNYYYAVSEGKATNVSPLFNPDIMDKSSVLNNVSLLPVDHNMDTNIGGILSDVNKYSQWDDNIDLIITTGGTTVFETVFPIFGFRKPSSNLADYQKLSYVYDNEFFSTEELSKINEDDIEYYKKSAVLIYKKDLMDFKNFFKKILEYGVEIYNYTNTVRESVMNQPQG